MSRRGFTMLELTLAAMLGFVTLPWEFFAALVAFTIAYLVIVELAKKMFYGEPVAAAEPPRTRGRTHRVHRRAAPYSHAGRLPSVSQRVAG